MHFYFVIVTRIYSSVLLLMVMCDNGSLECIRLPDLRQEIMVIVNELSVIDIEVINLTAMSFTIQFVLQF